MLSIQVDNRPLSEVLEIIEQQTSFSFIYDASVVDVNFRTTLRAQDKNIFDVLNLLFENSNIAFTVMNKQIILSRKETVALFQRAYRKLTGTVKDEKGEPVIGANIVVKGSWQGTISDVNGDFSIEVPLDSSIHISYIGYLPQEIIYIGQSHLQVTLVEDQLKLDEIVVTALGIKKRETSLPYTTETFTGTELTRVKDSNLMNSLAGKTAGVQINRNSSGLGGSSRVIIRGERSASGNNQPLYVIDGVPILNSTNEQAFTAIGGIANAANRDGGDGISNLNQDDIESVNILKGASASALYGSQAANGVILITTKSGKAGVRRIEFSSNLSFDKVISLPEFQNEYARSEGATSSWGAQTNKKMYDNLNDFFRTAVTANNSLSFTSGNERSQAYFSYANTTARGIMDNNDFSKHNINLREKAGWLNNRLLIDGNVNLIIQETKNKPTSGGIYMNPLSGLYTFPRGMDISPYKEKYEVFDAERNMPLQNWYTPVTDYDQNPYWLLNRAQSDDKRKRFILAVTASLAVNDHISIQARGSFDHIGDKFEQKIFASTSPGIAGVNGRYINYTYNESLIYGDVLATFDKKWENFLLNAVAGGSITGNRMDYLRLDSKIASLYYPNVFTISNINMSTNAYIDEGNDRRRQMQSLFATAQVGYRESLYLDVSARNDWASTLAFTKSLHSGFFYPSAGASWIMDKTLNMPEWVSLGKVRASWSKVGNDIPLFVSNPVSHIAAGGALLPNDTAPFGELKPEMSTSVEVGTEWRLFNHRLTVDLAFYKTNTYNQLFRLPSSAGAAYKYYYVNAGNIQNKGIEATISGNPILTPSFVWKTSLNFSRNKNLVKELHEELTFFNYGEEGFSSTYSMRLTEGGAFGDIYGKAFERDESGAIKYSQDGLPLAVGDGNTIKVGNCNPDFRLGWSHTFQYKHLSLYFLLDGRFGGDVLSQTQAILDQYGVSKVTGNARRKGYVELEGKQVSDVRAFYEQIGGRSGVTEYYMYDATNIRLRELSLGYSFPQKWLGKTKVFKELTLSLIARNLFFIYKDTPFDPDVVLSTSNSNQGIDIFGMPSTRSIGINLQVAF